MIQIKGAICNFSSKMNAFFIASVWRGCNHILQWSTCWILLLSLKANFLIPLWSL